MCVCEGKGLLICLFNLLLCLFVSLFLCLFVKTFCVCVRTPYTLHLTPGLLSFYGVLPD